MSKGSEKMKKYTPNDYMPFRTLNEDGIVLWKGTSEHTEKIHMHEFIEITYIFSGKGIHKINGTSYSVVEGDFLFINYHDTHSFEPLDKLTYCNILILPSFINDELVNSENAIDMLMLSTFNSFCSDIKSICPFIHFQKNEVEEIEDLIEKMLVEFENREKGYRDVLKSLMNLLLIKVFRKMQLEDNIGTISKTSKLAPEIIEYIYKNCFEKISLSTLAQKCFYNPSYFSRVFKDCYGMTLTTFIQKHRISKAQHLLIESTMSINKIYLYVGYSDKTQFYKIFKKYSNGLLPSKYREKFGTIDNLKQDSDNSD